VMRLQIHQGDCIDEMDWIPNRSVQCCVTSPPYFGLRDYGHDGQIGLEDSPDVYVKKMVDVFREVHRVLRDDGVLWLNLGDSYSSNGTTRWPNSNDGYGNGYGKAGAWKGGEHIRPKGGGLAPKQLIGIPWRVAFALQADGWYLRQDIIWHKPNPMPESVTDRCTKAHEYLFMLTKSARYYFNHEAIKEPANLTGKGNAASFRGGAYCNNATFNNSKGGNRTVAGNVGARSARDNFKRTGSKRAEPIPGQSVGTHREDRANSTYDPETRNRRSVWTVATRPYKGAHFATYPPALIEPCILSGSRPGDLVLDPFGGSGTTAEVALKNSRRAVLCELNADYVSLIKLRVDGIDDEL